jgi:lipoprotein-anchoring transpeptidase ErfK/SrfK
MPRYRYRRRKPNRIYLALVALMGGIAVAWWFWPAGDRGRPADNQLASTSQPALTSDRPEIMPDVLPRAGIAEKGDRRGSAADSKPPKFTGERTRQLLASGKKALARKDWLVAREQLNEALQHTADEQDRVKLRADLTRIAEETIFSARRLENDPLVTRYVIKAGDSLGKIAKAYRVSDDLLASVNGMRNKNLIREGQTIKIVQGPFHAVVDTETFALDVYLGDGDSRTFVKHFKAGLGEEGSTPRGVWRVKNKLKNPTYYPPRGGQIIGADNPENPLGERWIGLEGISGEAQGQQRYGIHGTIDPQSIGNNASLGCIRLYNEDVELLFDCLVVNHSTVEVK